MLIDNQRGSTFSEQGWLGFLKAAQPTGHPTSSGASHVGFVQPYSKPLYRLLHTQPTAAVALCEILHTQMGQV